jgi:AcrR family transcriptional regulator
MRGYQSYRNRLEQTQEILSQYLIPSSAKNPEAVLEKHGQIVEGACQVFFKKGFSRTSTRELASACHMSMGQLYHYISSKDDILFLVHKHMHQLWINHLLNSGLEDIGDAKLRLEKAIRVTLELTIENRKLFQFVYTESKHLAKEHLRLVLEIDEKVVLSFWRELLAEVQTKPFSQKEIPIAGSLIAFLSVFESLRGWTVKKFMPEEIVDFLTNFILGGLGLRTKWPSRKIHNLKSF